MSGEMIMIYFVREVNQVIMATALDCFDSRQTPLQTSRINCTSTQVMVLDLHFQLSNFTLATLECR